MLVNSRSIVDDYFPQFINRILATGSPVRDRPVIGHELKSCTSQLQPILLTPTTYPELPREFDGRLIIVDTPGFDDTYEDDSEILRRISVWLAASWVNICNIQEHLKVLSFSVTPILWNLEAWFTCTKYLSPVCLGPPARTPRFSRNYVVLPACPPSSWSPPSGMTSM